MRTNQPNLELLSGLPESEWRHETAVAVSQIFKEKQELESAVAQRLQTVAQKSDIPTMKQISDALKSSGSAPLLLSGLPGASGATVTVDVWANLPAVGGQSVGNLFWATDRTVLYLVETVSGTNAWVYMAGTMRDTLANLVAGLGTNDKNFRYFVTDYSHTLIWGGAAWGPNWPDGDDGSGYYQMYEIAPAGFGAKAWQVCDGSTVARLNPDATTTNVTVPDVAVSTYLKASTASAAVTAASGATTSDSAGTPSGTNSAPAFTGTPGNTGTPSATTTVDNNLDISTVAVASSTSTHPFTPAGTVAAPAFTGNALAGHSHGPNTLELRNKQVTLYYRR